MAFTSKKELVARIDAAFPVPRWAERDWPFTVKSMDAWLMARRVYGKTWADLSEADLRYLHSGVSMLTPVAHARFLPAFMKSALTDYDDVDLVADAVAWSYLGQGANGKGFKSMPLISAEKREVVFDFLEWYLDNEKQKVTELGNDSQELPGCLTFGTKRIEERLRQDYDSMVATYNQLGAEFGSE